MTMILLRCLMYVRLVTKLMEFVKNYKKIVNDLIEIIEKFINISKMNDLEKIFDDMKNFFNSIENKVLIEEEEVSKEIIVFNLFPNRYTIHFIQIMKWQLLFRKRNKSRLDPFLGTRDPYPATRSPQPEPRNPQLKA